MAPPADLQKKIAPISDTDSGEQIDEWDDLPQDEVEETQPILVAPHSEDMLLPQPPVTCIAPRPYYPTPEELNEIPYEEPTEEPQPHPVPPHPTYTPEVPLPTPQLPDLTPQEPLEPEKPVETSEPAPVEEKLEDDIYNKPPTEERPPFAFDGYESDEEQFLAQLPARFDADSDQIKLDHLGNPEEEKKFYETLVGALETYRAEVGSSPLQMPFGTPQMVLQPHHLRAMARVLKDPRLCGNVTTFQATHSDRWQKLTGLGLKWILNALHNNPSVSSVQLSQLNWSWQDADRFVRFLQKSPHITSVSFEKMTSSYGDSALKGLLRELPNNKTLRHLSLKGTTFSETTFLMLVDIVASNTTLETLNLRQCDFSYHSRAARFMQALVDNPDTKLKEIEWPLMRGAVLFMAQMLEYNKSISAIDLSNISLGPHVTLLQRALASNRTLKSLNLSNTSVNDAHLAVLLEPLWTNETLTHLDLSQNYNLTAESAKNIGDMLMQNVGLESLDISSMSAATMPKDRLAKYIGRALKSNASLHKLNLNRTNTESTGAAYIGEALAVNHGLHSLDLGNNSGFDDSALASLLKHIRNNAGLNSLQLRGCKLGDGAVKTMVPWLKVTTTFNVKLDVSGNRINGTSLDLLREAVMSNPSLRNLVLGEHAQAPSFLSRLANDVKFLFP